MSSIAAASSATPVLAVIDVETPGARAAFKNFADLLDRRFAGHRARPKAHFIALPQDPIEGKAQSERNAQQLREALVASKADIVLTSNDGFTRLAATLQFGKPIIFFSTTDPIAEGYTRSLTRPDKGMTGFTLGENDELKRFEMLLRLAPHCRTIGRLTARSYGKVGMRPSAELPEALKRVDIRNFAMDTPEELATMIALPLARKMDGWDVRYTNLTFRHSEAVVHALGKLRRPVSYPRMKFLHMGGMLAFEPKLEEADEAWVSQVASLLAGVPIHNIPVVQATRYSFGLNLKACRAVGVEPSKSLIRIADVVLE